MTHANTKSFARERGAGTGETLRTQSRELSFPRRAPNGGKNQIQSEKQWSRAAKSKLQRKIQPSLGLAKIQANPSKSKQKKSATVSLALKFFQGKAGSPLQNDHGFEEGPIGAEGFSWREKHGAFHMIPNQRGVATTADKGEITVALPNDIGHRKEPEVIVIIRFPHPGAFTTPAGTQCGQPQQIKVQMTGHGCRRGRPTRATAPNKAVWKGTRKTAGRTSRVILLCGPRHQTPNQRSINNLDQGLTTPLQAASF